MDRHGAWSRESGEYQRRRRAAARSEVEALLQEALLRELAGRVGESRLDAAVARVADRSIDPYAAVRSSCAGDRADALTDRSDRSAALDILSGGRTRDHSYSGVVGTSSDERGHRPLRYRSSSRPCRPPRRDVRPEELRETGHGSR